MDRDSIFSSEESHSEEITELRAQVHPEASASMNDHDCLRFLRARPGSIESAAAMVNACHAWRHTLMEPLPPSGLRFSPNTIMASPHLLPAHPHIHLLPGEHHSIASERWSIMSCNCCLHQLPTTAGTRMADRYTGKRPEQSRIISTKSFGISRRMNWCSTMCYLRSASDCDFSTRLQKSSPRSQILLSCSI